tara:strand:- start:60 stop:404 length:345 start_codon:yes stop_codon:yes gene_type:complete
MSGPFKMKNSGLKMSAKSGSPMQANYASPAKDGTRFIDKVKSFGKAVAENVGKVHGHGTDDSMSQNTYRSYKRLKKEYRDASNRDANANGNSSEDANKPSKGSKGDRSKGYTGI